MSKLKVPGSVNVTEETTIMDKAIFNDLTEWENPTLARNTSELIMNHHFNLYYKQNITYTLINALLYHILLFNKSKDYDEFLINKGMADNLFITLKRSKNLQNIIN